MKRLQLFPVATLAVLLTLTGCTGLIDEGSTVETVQADDGAAAYVQTWTHPYSETNCSQWKYEMTEQQRFAAAADILVSAWHKIEGTAGFPSDSLIRQFRNAIGDSCVNPAHYLTDVSYGVYVIDGETFEP